MTLTMSTLIVPLQAYLSAAEFNQTFQVPANPADTTAGSTSTKAVWYQQPKWKRNAAKKDVGLF